MPSKSTRATRATSSNRTSSFTEPVNNSSVTNSSVTNSSVTNSSVTSGGRKTRNKTYGERSFEEGDRSDLKKLVSSKKKKPKTPMRQRLLERGLRKSLSEEPTEVRKRLIHSPPTGQEDQENQPAQKKTPSNKQQRAPAPKLVDNSLADPSPKQVVNDKSPASVNPPQQHQTASPAIVQPLSTQTSNTATAIQNSGQTAAMDNIQTIDASLPATNKASGRSSNRNNSSRSRLKAMDSSTSMLKDEDEAISNSPTEQHATNNAEANKELRDRRKTRSIPTLSQDLYIAFDKQGFLDTISKMSPQELRDSTMETAFKNSQLQKKIDDVRGSVADQQAIVDKQNAKLQAVQTSLMSEVIRIETMRASVKKELDETKEMLQKQDAEMSLLKKELNNMRSQNSAKNPNASAPLRDISNLGNIADLDNSFNKGRKQERKSSKSERRSQFGSTLAHIPRKSPSDQSSLSLEDIIMDQKEILDFYSILCGISIQKVTPNQGGYQDKDLDGFHSADVNAFRCVVQADESSSQDNNFMLLMDYAGDKITYHSPHTTPTKSGDLRKKTSGGTDKMTYNSHDLYLLLRDILSN